MFERRFVDLHRPLRETGALPSVLRSLVLQEHLLDQQPECVGDAERERQGRIELPVLDRVDRVARNLDPVGELRLAPAALGPQDANAVVHAGAELTGGPSNASTPPAAGWRR